MFREFDPERTLRVKATNFSSAKCVSNIVDFTVNTLNTSVDIYYRFMYVYIAAILTRLFCDSGHNVQCICNIQAGYIFRSKFILVSCCFVRTSYWPAKVIKSYLWSYEKIAVFNASYLVNLLNTSLMQIIIMHSQFLFRLFTDSFWKIVLIQRT